MLGCSLQLLEQCLTKKSVETSKEFVLTPLSDTDVRGYEWSLFILFIDRVILHVMDSLKLSMRDSSRGL